MRLSTAITVALTVLLATSTVGVVAASPAASVLAPQSESADQSPLRSDVAAPASDSIASPPTATGTASIASSDGPAAADPKQVIRIDIKENGDAHWTIESRFVLTDDQAVDDFQAYANAVAAGQRDIQFDRQLFDYYANRVADRTGREMTIRNAGWDEPRNHSIEDDEFVDPDAAASDNVRIGVLSYSFTWTNFATVENDRIYVGDAFRTEDGVWLPLADSQRLVIEYPDEYALDTPSQLEWAGPYEFENSELELVFVRSASGDVLGLSRWMVGGVIVLVIVAGIGSYLFARRRPEGDLPAALEDLAERVAGLGITTRIGRLRSKVLDSDERSDREPSGVAGTDGGEVQSTAGSDSNPANGTELEFEEDADDGIDPELLSDEERVLRLLKQNGGRMKQGSIVSETGWSNAKVSQLLSQMDEDDDIEKLRIGRENLITLPEVDPTELD